MNKIPLFLCVRLVDILALRQQNQHAIVRNCLIQLEHDIISARGCLSAGEDRRVYEQRIGAALDDLQQHGIKVPLREHPGRHRMKLNA